MIEDQNGQSRASFGHRKMTIDQRNQSGKQAASSFMSTPSRRSSLGPIHVPQDMVPIEEIKHKNSSGFTVSLLAGDAPGYAHMRGGPLAGKDNGP